MKTFLQILFVLIFIFIVFQIGLASNKRDDAMLEHYKNCEPMVDIDGNHKMVCK